MSCHSRCSNSEAIQAPTRLIELNESDIWLRNPGDMAIFPPYATLSHCWGNLNIFKLEENNLTPLYRDIPVERLCKTFRDAATVTRALGLNYLRIDALRITQEEEKKWHQESALMSGVYGNSTVNIAAKDNSFGLFPNEISPDYQESTFGHHQEIYKLQNGDSYKRSLAETPLATVHGHFKNDFWHPTPSISLLIIYSVNAKSK